MLLSQVIWHLIFLEAITLANLFRALFSISNFVNVQGIQGIVPLSHFAAVKYDTTLKMSQQQSTWQS